jgi:hypothetical protein
MQTEKWAVSYSQKQDCFHREKLSEYLNSPQNNYRLIAIFTNQGDCQRFIAQKLKEAKAKRARSNF